jgi:serine/threonine-protein kinase
MLTTLERTHLSARELLSRHGEVFAVFDAATQDSGNVSYGLQNGSERLFVKTAGAATNTEPLSFGARVALLRNAVRLACTVHDPALPTLRNVVESDEGPFLVYEWVEGELLRAASARRSEPASAFARFRGLAAAELSAALDVVFRLHVELARHGYVACDFYDGCLIYARARCHHRRADDGVYPGAHGAAVVSVRARGCRRSRGACLHVRPPSSTANRRGAP